MTVIFPFRKWGGDFIRSQKPNPLRGVHYFEGVIYLGRVYYFSGGFLPKAALSRSCGLDKGYELWLGT